jgi:hypothetical protein
LLLATWPTLTLLVLVGEVSAEAGADACGKAKACMDDVEQLLIACFRRSDVVIRCGERSCAAILLGAEGDGALHAVRRFRRMLSKCKPLTSSLQIGIASAPEQAAESQTLVALALKPRLRMVPATGAGKGTLPRLDQLVEREPAMTLAQGQPSAAQEKASKAATHLRPPLTVPFAAEFSSEARLALRGREPMQRAEPLARARARTLGVPYIAPPQRIPGSVRNLLPVEVMRQLQCLPIGRDRNALTVALADPTDSGVLHQLREITGLNIFPVMTDPDALEALAQPTRSRRANQLTPVSARSSGK